MMTFVDYFILDMMRQTDQTKEELFAGMKRVNARLMEKSNEGEMTAEEAGAYILNEVITDHKIFNISPVLQKKLRKTKIPMNMKYILKKAWECHSYNNVIHFDDFYDRPIAYPINIDKRLTVFTFGKDFLVVHSTTGSVDFSLRFDLFNDQNVSLDEEIDNAYYYFTQIDKSKNNVIRSENLNKKQFTNIIRDFFSSLVYILCSGQPDVREINNVAEVKTKKKLRKVLKHGFDQPLVPRIDVGLGYEKERLYTKDKWERMSHLRWQPYGPKDNVQYKLIEIAATEVTRRKKTLTNASATT